MTLLVAISVAFFIVIFYLAFQIFLSGRFLHWFLNYLGRGAYTLDWKGGGIHFPWMVFRIRNFRIYFPGANKTDIIEITASEVSGRLSFSNLFRGRIVLRTLDLQKPKGSYINRQPSEQKVEHLPKRKLVMIQNANIDSGELYIEDHNMTPIYKILISDIFVKNLNMDCGCPMTFLFQSEYGRCKLGEKGRLFVEKSDETNGHITLTGATWTDLAGLKVIPLPILNDRIDLRASFQNFYSQDTIAVKGTLRGSSEHTEVSAQELLTRIESQDTKDRASSFRLEIDWNEYALPFDLALKKLLLEIFHKLKIKGVVGFTIHTVTKGIVNIFSRG
jgi:hypothetical protein